MAGVGFAIVAKIWIQPAPLWGWLQTKRRFILLLPNMAYNYMTQAGYDKLVAEINELEAVHRPEISRQIAEARDKGDLSENAEYEAARVRLRSSKQHWQTLVSSTSHASPPTAYRS